MDNSDKFKNMCKVLPGEIIKEFSDCVAYIDPESVDVGFLLDIVTSRDPSPIGFFTLQNFKGFVDYRCGLDHEWPLKFRTLEQMALCYVMWMKYEMAWTGENWGEVEK